MAKKRYGRYVSTGVTFGSALAMVLSAYEEDGQKSGL